jgi:hypothetical protein
MQKITNVQPGMSLEDMNKSFIRVIFIWFPISIAFVLYFVIYEMINMPIQKNSILYAKYGTNKCEKAGR